MTHIEQLLLRYMRWRTGAPLEFPSRPTVEARIQDMQENAGVPNGSGIKYSIYEVDGETFTCAPDGGLGDLCEMLDARMRFDRAMREVAEAIRLLPDRHRGVIQTLYHVNAREPLSVRALAELLAIPRTAADNRRAQALGYLEASLVGRGLLRAA